MSTIKLPQTGKTMRSGTVRRWLKKPGDVVARGDVLAQVETEDGLLEIESPLAGKLRQILVADGHTAAVHAALAEIEEGAGPAAATTPTVAAVKPAVAEKAQPRAGGQVTPILMPKAGQSMEEGTILKWRVQPGAKIGKGDVIFEVETDKASMEVEALDAGRLARIVVADGGTLPVLQPVAFLAENDADVDAFITAQGLEPVAVATTTQAHVASASASSTHHAVSALAVSAGGRVRASPAARKIALERRIDLRSLARGTGPGGRILSSDVPLVATGVSPLRRPMSRMRKAIARNLLQSKQTIPHFYIRLTVDAGPMLAFHKAQKAQYPCSINDVIVLACARVIQEFPAFRSRIEGEEIVETPSANIGIAVGMDDGLVVPVLVGADRLTLQQIGAESKRLAASARAGKIEGMGQGTFTITNLGMFGTEEFAAIINPPETAILAVGAAREAVIVTDGAMRPGRVMTTTLSSDHRIVDGMVAAKFFARLKELLESPEKLLPQYTVPS